MNYENTGKEADSYPMPGSNFWKQFDDPTRAYSCLAMLIKGYRANKERKVPDNPMIDDYVRYAYAVAHGQKPYPSEDNKNA